MVSSVDQIIIEFLFSGKINFSPEISVELVIFYIN